MKSSALFLKGASSLLLAQFLFLLFCSSLPAAVNFTITPSAVSNTYAGNIVLQVTGLSGGQSVLVQKYLDLNTNGVIDGGDFLWQQFQLTDGQASVIGGVTNINVPGDNDSVAGQITSRLLFRVDDPVKNVIGRYFYRLSSPTGLFAPLTNSFSITNTPFGQSFSGNVVNNGTNVPNAIVLVFQPGPEFVLAGTVANNTGAYSIRMPAGTYALAAFKSNYLGNLSPKPVTLNASASLATNIVMSNATASISGRLVDATNNSIGLPGLPLHSELPRGLTGIGATDTNGYFNFRVASGQLQFGASGLGQLGYLDIDSDENVIDTSTGSVSGLVIRYPKANALFYGSVKDDQNRPVAGVFVAAYDNEDKYKSGTFTDTNGNYVLGALNDGPWEVEIDVTDQIYVTNYVFSQGLYYTNLSAGQALLHNFTALPATRRITGHVQDVNGKAITHVTVYANADINGKSYETDIRTDTNGNYSLDVANGSWGVGVGCWDDDWDPADCCPSEQNFNISGANAVANFASPGKIVITSPMQLPDGVVGEQYNYQFTASDCGFLGWSSTNVPSGLDVFFDGTLSGFPDTPGSYHLFVEVDTGYGKSLVKEFLLLIRNPGGVPDVQYYIVQKRKAWHQTSAGSPVLDSAPGPYHSYLLFRQSGIGLVPSASCTLPTAVTKTFPSGDSGLDLIVHDTFATQAALDAAYPAGNYAFTFHTVDDGDRFPTVTTPAAAVYPTAPHIVNFAEAQAVKPQFDFALQFDPFATGTNDDIVYLSIQESNGAYVFEAIYPFTDTEIWVPAGLLEFNHAYSATVVFFYVTVNQDVAAYPGVNGVTSIGAGTSLPLITTGDGPFLTEPEKLSPTQFGFVLNGIFGQNYTIQRSTNIASPNWTLLFVTNAPAGSFYITDPTATNTRAFYRVLLGP